MDLEMSSSSSSSTDSYSSPSPEPHANHATHVLTTHQGPPHPSNATAGFIYPGHHELSTTSSSSSLNPISGSTSNSASKRKKGRSSSRNDDDDDDDDERDSARLGGLVKMTPKMIDRQARGKEWDFSDTDDEDESDVSFRRQYEDHHTRLKHLHPSNQNYESQQRRRKASLILDNPELLMMYASARSDSIPATRLHFTKVFCGHEEVDDIRSDTYKERDGKLQRKNKNKKMRPETAVSSAGA